MALTKTVNIDGKDVTFKASAAIPRIYRNRFHRDIYKDLHDLQKSIDQEDPEASALDTFSLELFEDISYIMAKHADPQGVPDTPDEWLDQFGTFSIYQILPEIIDSLNKMEWDLPQYSWGKEYHTQYMAGIGKKIAEDLGK